MLRGGTPSPPEGAGGEGGKGAAWTVRAYRIMWMNTRRQVHTTLFALEAMSAGIGPAMPFHCCFNLLVELTDVERFGEDRDPILIEPRLMCLKIEECC